MTWRTGAANVFIDCLSSAVIWLIVCAKCWMKQQFYANLCNRCDFSNPLGVFFSFVDEKVEGKRVFSLFLGLLSPYFFIFASACATSSCEGVGSFLAKVMTLYTYSSIHASLNPIIC